MGIVIRQSILTSVISYLGVIIGYFNVLWLFPALLTPDEIGLTRVIQDIAILMVPFAQIGLGQSLVRFFPYFKSGKNEHGLLSAILVGALFGFSLFLLIFFIFKDNILSIFIENSPLVIQYYPLILWLTFFLVIYSLLEAYSRSLLKIAAPNFIRDIFIRLLISLLVLFYFLEYIQFEGLLVSLVVVYAISLALLALYLVKLKSVALDFNFKFLTAPLVQKIALYSVFTLVGTSGIMIVGKVDSLMVTSMLGLTETAIYTTAFYIAVVIEMPKRAITQIASPLVSKYFENTDLKGLKLLYQKVSLNQLLVGFLIFIGVWANIENIFYLIPNSEIYEAGKMVVIIIGLGKLTDMVAGINGEIIVMSKYYKFNIVTIGILAVITIAANYYLIPIHGINGAAIASAAALFIFNLTKYLFVILKFRMQPFTWNTLKILIVGAVIFYLSHFIPVQSHVLIDIILRSGFILLSYTIIVYVLNISPEANHLFHQAIGRLKK